MDRPADALRRRRLRLLPFGKFSLPDQPPRIPHDGQRGVHLSAPAPVHGHRISSDLSVKLLLVSPEYLYALPVSFGFDWLKHVEASPRLPLPAEKIADLTALYTLLERYDTDNKQAPPIRDALLLPFLLIIIAQVEPAATASGGSKVSRQEWLTRRFFGLMSEHFESQRQVSFYADRLCITAKRLSAAVKETSGHTALEWLNEAALVEAKRCLRTTDLTVLQISEALHFSTASSFVRFFRQHAGCTPLEYRRR